MRAIFPLLKTKKFTRRENAKASGEVTITNTVFQISGHKSILFLKSVHRIGKMPANLAVFISINFLPPNT